MALLALLGCTWIDPDESHRVIWFASRARRLEGVLTPSMTGASVRDLVAKCVPDRASARALNAPVPTYEPWRSSVSPADFRRWMDGAVDEPSAPASQV
jgi:hypothetical protein